MFIKPMDEKQPEQSQSEPNGLRVYHVETGEALATHQEAHELAMFLMGLKLGEAVIIRAVVVEG